MKHVILGTAGHVDHGKTALVRRLTGIDTDRLQEEKSRGISIELGFAPLILPNNISLGIVDVPGHEHFIKTMLAGAAGMDLVLFVIAADEGIMPQTREHMDILNLLGVTRGAVVITKTDLVDAEWLSLVREEIQTYLADTPFSTAEIVEVSSVTGAGIDQLLQVLMDLCASLPERSDSDRSRLAVDRIFTMPGFGTVVTGTLWSGSLSVNQKLDLHPSQKEVRIRGLQVHGEKRQVAYAGERVAVNLANIEKKNISRGDWLAEAGWLSESYRIDIQLNLLPDAPDMRHNERVHVHHGASHALARVSLLDRDVLPAGESCFAQLLLETPLTAVFGDRMVLRFYSPLSTIGGGIVLDPVAPKHKRNHAKTLELLAEKASGDTLTLLFHDIDRSPSLWTSADAELRPSLDKLVSSGQIVCLEDRLYLSSQRYCQLKEQVQTFLCAYHQQFPLRPGVPKQELLSRFCPNFDQKEFKSLIAGFEADQVLASNDAFAFLSDFHPQLPAELDTSYQDLLQCFIAGQYAPPSLDCVCSTIGLPLSSVEELLSYACYCGSLVRCEDGLIFSAETVSRAEQTLREQTQDSGFTLAQARDLWGTSRKYALALVDYFAKSRLTRRSGDIHLWL